MRLLVFALLISLTVNAEEPKVIGQSFLGVVKNNNGKLFFAKKRGARKFVIYDTKKNIKQKSKKIGKEFALHSNVIAIKNKWIYANNSENGKFNTADYKIVELNEDGSYSFHVAGFNCEEDIGSYKFYGITATTSQVPYDVKMQKSSNDEYFSCVSSKIWGSTTAQAANVKLNDYKKTKEITHFALYNSRLELIKKGSFQTGVLRGDVRSFETYVSGKGDVFLIYDLRQEDKEKTNRILIVKISKEGESVEKIALNIPKLNTSAVSCFFDAGYLKITGVVLTPDHFLGEKQAKGVFYSSISTNLFKIDDLNVILFDEKQKTNFNEIYKKNGAALAKWEPVNNSVFPQLKSELVQKEGDVFGMLLRFYVPMVTDDPIFGKVIVGYSHSSYFLLRFGSEKKSIHDITMFKNLYGRNNNLAVVFSINKDVIFSYYLKGVIYGVKLSDDLSIKLKDEFKLSTGLSDGGRILYNRIGGYATKEETSELYIGVSHISGFVPKGKRIGMLKLSIPKD